MFPTGPTQQRYPYGARHQPGVMNQPMSHYPVQPNPQYGHGQFNPRVRRGLFAPQGHQQAHPFYQQPQQQFYNQPQAQQMHPQQMQQPQQYQPMPKQQKGLGSLIKDEQGNFDMKKVGSGVQGIMGIASQAGPFLKMLGL